VFKPSLVIVVLLAAVSSVWGQASMVRPPEMPGVFQPVVGAGATYRVVTAHNPEIQFTYAIVGKEDAGYWMEIRTGTPKGDVVMKQLMSVASDGKPHVIRMIMQAAGQPPMELPAAMITGAAGHAQAQGAANAHGMGAKVGTETITVPAGTFECEHYTSELNGKHSDLWVSSKVSPYGLVKMTSGETQMELQKVLVNETSRITGEPMKLPGYPAGK
jgi:hypothetical protein